MKILFTIFLYTINSFAFAAAFVPNYIVVTESRHLDNYEEQVILNSIVTTDMAMTTTTTFNSPILGIAIFADGNELNLDLNNEALIEEIENIQILLEEENELSNLQKNILAIGMNANQLDMDARILGE